METEHLSIRLHTLMLRLGIRRKDALAERLGYSRTQVYMIEKGEAPVTGRFLEALERLETEAGIRGEPTEHREDSQTSVQSLREDPRPYGLRTAQSDAEIAGLAALVHLHAARVHAGERTGDIPVIRHALEKALEQRGVLPKAV